MSTEKKKFNWGILGAGKIAGKFATDLALLENANLYAVGSRSIQKAEDFKGTYHFEKAYGSYGELLDDANLDVVYIATPNSEHYKHSLAALDKGIAVLCEKPLAINAYQVQNMIQKAKDKETFLMEALWTLFLPHLQTIKELVDKGAIGELQSVRSNFGFKANFEAGHRLFNPELGGGALLDIGIYPLLLAQTVLGVPDHISATAVLTPTTVDEEIGITLTYQNQRIAHLDASLRSRTPVDAYIHGSKGYIYIPGPWHKPVFHVVVYDNASSTETKHSIPSEGLGYKYEAEKVMEYLEAGLLESPIASWQFSMDLVETMDEIRKQVGVSFPLDGDF